MAISEPFELDGVTIGTTEWSIPRDAAYDVAQSQTAAGVYQLWIDPGNVAKADEFKIRAYEKVEATGGTKKMFAYWSIMGVQSGNLVTPTFILMNGWDFTIQKLAGTDRAFDAVIRKVA